MWAGQVVPKESSPFLDAPRLGTGQQLLDQVPPEAQLRFRHRPTPRQLEREDGSGVLERHRVGGLHRSVGVEEDDHPDDLVSRPGDGQEPPVVTNGASAGHRPAK